MSTTGIAGLTLHGGYGHLRRTYGLSIDSLLSVQIVTADGQVRTASPTENADLFWVECAPVTVVNRQAVGTPRPMGRIVRERFSSTRATWTTHSLIAAQPFA